MHFACTFSTPLIHLHVLAMELPSVMRVPARFIQCSPRWSLAMRAAKLDSGWHTEARTPVHRQVESSLPRGLCRRDRCGPAGKEAKSRRWPGRVAVWPGGRESSLSSLYRRMLLSVPQDPMTEDHGDRSIERVLAGQTSR
jgi:hypothetical protein